MSNPEIFTTNSYNISSSSFYPRNYSSDFLFVKENLASCSPLSNFISGGIRVGSTPSAYLFVEPNEGIRFIKTAAVTSHFINVNDLQWINEDFHREKLKRSITRPYDIIYTTTGKFMGKAALCPPTIPEMNMSQNSVVLHTNSPRESAFLTIFLNSNINRIQVRGIYSITKQKYMNQGKIASLKVIGYDHKYDEIMDQYLESFYNYYISVKEIQDIIQKFNKNYTLPYSDSPQYGYWVKPNTFTSTMLTPNFYRTDISDTLSLIQKTNGVKHLKENELSNGDEIGSANYLDEGIPFIKTSDIMNFDINYEPNYYCAETYLSQLHQNIKKGDILFTKDGKPGQIAIVEEDNNIVISSGLIKYHPQNINESYWIFLLLSSKYGEAYFKQWFVLSSTILHLRSDFFSSFLIPEVSDEILKDYVKPLESAFEKKKISYDKIKAICKLVEKSYVQPDTELKL